jgi:hypothetical protein
VLDIVAVDGKNGNSGFLRSVKGLRNGTVARLRSDRVLCQAPPARTGKRGRPRIHGERFAFKEPDTWGDPDEMIELKDEHFGKVLFFTPTVSRDSYFCLSTRFYRLQDY